MKSKLKKTIIRNIIFHISVLLIVMVSMTEITYGQNQAQEQCAVCHGQSVYEQLEESAHEYLTCESCHQGYQQFPHPEPVISGSELCGTCHGATLLEYDESVHGQLGFDCASCHEQPHDIKNSSHPESSVHRLQEAETCGNCHRATVPYRSYRDSFHGIGNAFGSIRNAVCSDCHTSHFILNEIDSRSSVHTDNVAETCAVCHVIAAKGFAQGKEHFVIEPTGYALPMFITLRFFTWLTIIVITLLIVHMQLELYRRLKNAQAKERKEQKRGKQDGEV